MCAGEWQIEKQRERIQAGSVSAEPDAGLDLKNSEIMT